MPAEGLMRAMVEDDHPIVVNGLREVLEASGRIQVVGQAGDGEEAVRVAGRRWPYWYGWQTSRLISSGTGPGGDCATKPKPASATTKSA